MNGFPDNIYLGEFDPITQYNLEVYKEANQTLQPTSFVVCKNNMLDIKQGNYMLNERVSIMARVLLHETLGDMRKGKSWDLDKFKEKDAKWRMVIPASAYEQALCPIQEEINSIIKKDFFKEIYMALWAQEIVNFVLNAKTIVVWPLDEEYERIINEAQKELRIRLGRENKIHPINLLDIDPNLRKLVPRCLSSDIQAKIKEDSNKFKH